jgi:hypothetical protein
MKLYRLFLLLLVFGMACQHKTYNFPNQINNPISDKHKQIGSTGVFLILPDEMSFSTGSGIYSIPEQLSITATENPGTDFSKALSEFESGLKQEMEITFEQKFQLQRYEGHVFIALAKKNEDPSVHIIFGDQERTAILLGFAKKGSAWDAQKILDIFSTVVYDPTVQALSKEPDFTFDINITGYQPTASVDRITMYSENGEADLDSAFANSIQFELMQTQDKKYVEEFLVREQEHYAANGIVLKEKQFHWDTIGKYPTLVFESEINVDGQPGYLMQYILLGEFNHLSFVGSIKSKTEERRSAYLKTIESIQLR